MEIFAGHEVIRTIEEVYAIRLREVPPYTYVGKAAAGAVEGDPVWQIQRLDETLGLDIKFPNGDDRFNNKWTDYLTLSYM